MRPRPDVESELVDQSVLASCDETIWRALSAFGSDPTYLTQMVEAANTIETRRRDAWVARKEARGRSVPEESPQSIAV